MLGEKFLNKYGNFNNKKFLELLKNSRKKLDQKRKGQKNLDINISLFNSVSQKELWQFINKMSTFINSGIDIKGALNILVKQVKNPYLKKIANEIKTNIDYGISISETMMQYPKVFDNLTIALIGVGEKTGTLGKILAEIDQKMLENIELKSKVKGALIYPVILLFLTFAMVTFMMIVIIPRITESFAQSGTDLPHLTQVVINISNFFREDYLIVIGILIALIVFMKILKKIYLGELLLGYIAVNLPVFGHIIKQSNIIYFINSFTLLLQSGVLLLESLKISSNVVPNIHYKREIVRIKNEVESGLTISKSLGLNLEYETNVYLNKLFPEELAYIVNTGEETGTLGDSLRKIGKNYTSELKRFIGNLATMLEPIIIVLVGFLVGVIVIAIMLPFFQLGEVAKNM